MGNYFMRLFFSLVLAVPAIMLAILGVQEWLAMREVEAVSQSAYDLLMWMIPAVVLGGFSFIVFRSATSDSDRYR
ncbi:MAG TPA: hypothetical protein VFS96_09860 [Nitrolancea sp.]|nr:hypothetical protein [Nitrolancea sp.]